MHTLALLYLKPHTNQTAKIQTEQYIVRKQHQRLPAEGAPDEGRVRECRYQKVFDYDIVVKDSFHRENAVPLPRRWRL